MHYITGNYVEDSGALGRHQRLVVDDGCDPTTGERLTWRMEAQTKTISAPVVRGGVWAFAADSATDCERALGPATDDR